MATTNTEVQFGTGSPQTLVFDRGTHIALGPQSAVGSPRMDADFFSKYRYAVNTLSFNPTSTLLSPNVIPTTIEPFPSTSGPVDLTGNWTMDMLPERMEILWAQLLNNNATSIDGTNAGTTFAEDNSADHIYVAAGATFSSSGEAATVLPRPDAQLAKGAQQLEVTATGASAATTSNPYCVVIVGRDINNSPITETLYITGATGSATTLNYFLSIPTPANGGKVTAIGGAGTFTLTGQASTNRKTSSLSSVNDNNNRQSNGLTIELNYGTPGQLQRGALTETLTDAFINTFTCTADKASLATCTWGFTAKGILPGVNPTGGKGPMPDASRDAGTIYGAGNFMTAQDGQVPFPGSGVALYLDDRDGNSVRINQLENFNLSVDNSTNFTNRTGSVLPGIPYNGVRIGTGSFQMELHSNDTDYANAYLYNRFINDGRFTFRHPGNKTRSITIKVACMQLSGYPVRTTQGGEYVQHQINFTMLPSSSAAVDSVTVDFEYDTTATEIVINNT